MKRNQQQQHSQGCVRHAEKRRTSTCRFADRIASISIKAFHESVPSEWRDQNKQVCLATIVAHWKYSNNSESVNEDEEINHTLKSIDGDEEKQEVGYLQVVSLGVGTKFLSKDLLSEESSCIPYGKRIRDSHAEILARRAFQRQLMMEMQDSLTTADEKQKRYSNRNTCYYRSILEKHKVSQKFHLVNGVTLHMYTSSAPCGNSCLKKFAQMSKEKFQDNLNPDEWPTADHKPMPSHSTPLGQLSLLVKKDALCNNDGKNYSESKGDILDENSFEPPLTKKQKTWPATISDDWCPPGTSTVYLKKGTIHTCSDKICRWNCIGLQGSLLASILESPLYMTSLTVGRKLTSVCCQRAVCCRAQGYGLTKTWKRRNKKNDNLEETSDRKLKTLDTDDAKIKFKLNHTSIMGTAVYLDQSGVLDMSGSKKVGHDVRFLSNRCWIWWPSIHKSQSDEKSHHEAECIDGETGLKVQAAYKDTDTKADLSEILSYSETSTYSLTKSFMGFYPLIMKDQNSSFECMLKDMSLKSLRKIKRQISPEYETAKDLLLHQHVVFRHWRRRFKE